MSGLGHFHGAAASHLTATMQVSGTAPHHTADRELQRNTPREQFDHLVHIHGE